MTGEWWIPLEDFKDKAVVAWNKMKSGEYTYIYYVCFKSFSFQDAN